MKELLIADKADVLVADDQPGNLRLLVSMLSNDYRVHPFTDGASLVGYVRAGYPVDLVLLDIMMPEMDGYEACRQLRRLPAMEDVPIIFLTGLSSLDDEIHGLEAGAIDYITKPFSPPIVMTRVRNHVQLGRALRLIVSQNDHLEHRVAQRTAELAHRNTELGKALHQVAVTQDVTIVAFSSLAEARDNDTGQHIRRTQSFVRELALALRANPQFNSVLDDNTITEFYKSAPLHDIGKVAIPDHILLKPGKLTVEEFAIMKTHADHGRRAIEAAEANLDGESSFLRHAREIAYGHHEKWDGTGYPCGTAGEAIPISARLMAIADVYDALTSQRIYKPAMPHEDAVRIIANGRGNHFDPLMVDCFIQIEATFADIAARYTEKEEAPV
jgi:putative two-component system response regulator